MKTFSVFTDDPWMTIFSIGLFIMICICAKSDSFPQSRPMMWFIFILLVSSLFTLWALIPLVGFTAHIFVTLFSSDDPDRYRLSIVYIIALMLGSVFIFPWIADYAMTIALLYLMYLVSKRVVPWYRHRFHDVA